MPPLMADYISHSIKQVRMRTGTDKHNLITGYTPYQQPIRRYMALVTSLENSMQGVR
ncbi:hypothetical protein Barb6XT_01210 [Bacteroidales bacterium Barb6XT]|nr:hypothetical protein Barb6XT_01210 [Bacteroidales bacterium Barb6XT]